MNIYLISSVFLMLAILPYGIFTDSTSDPECANGNCDEETCNRLGGVICPEGLCAVNGYQCGTTPTPPPACGGPNGVGCVFPPLPPTPLPPTPLPPTPLPPTTVTTTKPSGCHA